MKRFINNASRYTLVALAAVAFSCDDETEIAYNDETAAEQVIIDPYLQIGTPVVGFQAGTESYDIEFNVLNGSKDINKVNVYSTFTDVSGDVSNEVLFTSFDVTEPLRSQFADNFTYEDLKAGLTVAGQPLPTDQFELAVGAGWQFRFEGVRPDGEVLPLAGVVNIAVLSPYAGIYEYTHLEYYRINVLRNDVTGPVVGTHVFIGSVDEDTFSHNDWWGPFAWTGSAFHFNVDLTPDVNGNFPITGYEFPDGIYSGNRAITCATEPGTMPNAHCGESDYLDPDTETGVHKLYMSYGYFTDGSGAREFYCELTKVVE